MTDRRKIREKYRELKVLSEENEDSVHWATTGKLEEILLTANKLHERVEKPREHAADTELLQQIAASGLSAAKLSFHAGKRLNTAKDLVQAMKCEYLPGWTPDETADNQNLEDFDWDKCADNDSCYWSRTSCGITTMFGPFQNMIPKAARQSRERKAREPLGELVNPEELTDAHACCSEQQETDKNMEEMITILMRNYKKGEALGGGVQFPQLVFNPKSFSQTVENIFTLSFLVKDGRVRLEDHPSGKGLQVRAVVVRERAREGATATVGKVQYISSFNMKTWRKMQERVPAAECLMKHRVHEGLENQEIPATPDISPSGGAKRRPNRAAGTSPAKRRASRKIF